MLTLEELEIFSIVKVKILFYLLEHLTKYKRHFLCPKIYLSLICSLQHGMLLATFIIIQIRWVMYVCTLLKRQKTYNYAWYSQYCIVYSSYVYIMCIHTYVLTVTLSTYVCMVYTYIYVPIQKLQDCIGLLQSC